MPVNTEYFGTLTSEPLLGLRPRSFYENYMNDYDKLAEIERKKLLKINSRRLSFLIISVIAIIIVVGYSFTIGSSSLTALEAYKIILNQIFPGTFEVNEMYTFVLTEIRAPRVLGALFIGMVLAIGGCLIQSILKNPIATPYTLGISAGAGFGVNMLYIFGISVIPGTIGVITNAFIFSMIPALVMIAAVVVKKMSPVVMVLTGIAISYLFSAMNMLSQYFGNSTNVQNVVLWSIGDLSSICLWQIPYVICAFVLIFAYSMFMGKNLDIMRMGDDSAKSLGINTAHVRSATVIITCIVTAVIVSFAGPIGFVCILSPQISRKIVGNNIRWLVPTSAIIGGMLLLFADIIAKTILSPIMLPVGAITAVIGAPLLIYMLFSKKTVAI